MGDHDGANEHEDYQGQYEAQDRRAVPQPQPPAYSNNIVNSTPKDYTNGNAGQLRLADGVAIEHAGPGFNKVEQSRNF